MKWKIKLKIFLLTRLSGSVKALSYPLLYWPQRSSSFALCNDFRKVNDVTIKNKIPISVIKDLLDELHGPRYPPKSTLRGDYYQIGMNDRTSKKYHLGHHLDIMNVWSCHLTYQIPVGDLWSQARMNKIFVPHIKRFFFFDDILIYTNNYQEHLEHLEVV